MPVVAKYLRTKPENTLCRNNCCRALARQHTILDIHLCPVSLAELRIVDVNRDLFKIWMSVGKPGGHGG